MRLLVTGADGFAGRHLCAFLRAAGENVTPVLGPRAAEEKGSATLHIDVTQESAVRNLVETTQPEGIIHLAGFSSVARSHQHPGRTFAVNTHGTVNLLAAVRDLAPRARVLVVSSGEVYGPIPEGTKATEESPLNPVSPHAVSKVAAELAVHQFHRSYGLQVVIARAFTHLGAGQDPVFVIPSFAAQIRAVLRGRVDPVLKTGNLATVRDFSHVSDVIAAYRLLLQKGEAGATYNVCSGEARSLQSVLDELIALAKVEVRLELDPARLRSSDIPYLVGSADRLRALGWAPRRTVSEALGEVLGDTAVTA